MLPNCEYCSEPENGEDIVCEVTLWRSPSGRFGEVSTEIVLNTGKFMHKACALLKADEDRQQPGQLKLV